jgi:hypothetical protein
MRSHSSDLAGAVVIGQAENDSDCIEATTAIAALNAATLFGRWQPAAGDGLSLQSDDLRLINMQFPSKPHTGIIYTPPSYSDHVAVSVLLNKAILQSGTCVPACLLAAKDTKKCQPWHAQASIGSFFGGNKSSGVVAKTEIKLDQLSKENRQHEGGGLQSTVELSKRNLADTAGLANTRSEAQTSASKSLPPIAESDRKAQSDITSNNAKHDVQFQDQPLKENEHQEGSALESSSELNSKTLADITGGSKTDDVKFRDQPFERKSEVRRFEFTPESTKRALSDTISKEPTSAHKSTKPIEESSKQGHSDITCQIEEFAFKGSEQCDPVAPVDAGMTSKSSTSKRRRVNSKPAPATKLFTNGEKALLEEADAMGLGSALRNLAGREDIIKRGFPLERLFDVLRENDGLVNKAKSALL